MNGDGYISYTRRDAMLKNLSERIGLCLKTKKQLFDQACIDLATIHDLGLYEDAGFVSFLSYHRWLGISGVTAANMVEHGRELLDNL